MNVKRSQGPVRCAASFMEYCGFLPETCVQVVTPPRKECSKEDHGPSFSVRGKSNGV